MNQLDNNLQQLNKDKSLTQDEFSKESRQSRIVEALLFASNEPLSEELISQQLKEELSIIKTLIENLKDSYSSRGINLVFVGHGWVFRTAPDLAEDLTIYRKVKRRLSRADLETLAIIAYHQPITRAEIEDIRGVALSRCTLDHLLEAGWIKPKWKRHTPGRPSTWVTTQDFLTHFGLGTIDDLPNLDELNAGDLIDLESKLKEVKNIEDPTLFTNSESDTSMDDR